MLIAFLVTNWYNIISSLIQEEIEMFIRQEFKTYESFKDNYEIAAELKLTPVEYESPHGLSANGVIIDINDDGKSEFETNEKKRGDKFSAVIKSDEPMFDAKVIAQLKELASEREFKLVPMRVDELIGTELRVSKEKGTELYTETGEKGKPRNDVELEELKESFGIPLGKGYEAAINFTQPFAPTLIFYSKK
jgi:hypothetical protein